MRGRKNRKTSTSWPMALTQWTTLQSGRGTIGIIQSRNIDIIWASDGESGGRGDVRKKIGGRGGIHFFCYCCLGWIAFHCGWNSMRIFVELTEDVVLLVRRLFDTRREVAGRWNSRSVGRSIVTWRDEMRRESGCETSMITEKDILGKESACPALYDRLAWSR